MIALLAAEMSRLDLHLADALHAATGTLHERTLANYTRWTRYHGIAAPSAARKRRLSRTPLSAAVLAHEPTSHWPHAHPAAVGAAGEPGANTVLSTRLHRLVLWFLVWGEAANLRHTPELLCFVFYCASNALLLPDTTGAGSVVTQARVIDHASLGVRSLASSCSPTGSPFPPPAGPLATPIRVAQPASERAGRRGVSRGARGR